jgi:hypothetical protein
MGGASLAVKERVVVQLRESSQILSFIEVLNTLREGE